MILLMHKKKAKGDKMNKKEKELLKIMEIAKNTVVIEDLSLLKELAKH